MRTGKIRAFSFGVVAVTTKVVRNRQVPLHKQDLGSEPAHRAQENAFVVLPYEAKARATLARVGYYGLHVPLELIVQGYASDKIGLTYTEKLTIPARFVGHCATLMGFDWNVIDMPSALNLAVAGS